MTQRVFVLGAVAILFLASTTFGQEKKASPASPSDISVDQIKKESAKSSAKQESDAKANDAKAADAKNDTPKPVMQGTAVAQPDCGTSQCDSCSDSCNPCRKRCRGRLMGRLRGMFSRKCCCG